MAISKKTNKTAHVLSLIATDAPEEAIAEQYNAINGITSKDNVPKKNSAKSDDIPKKRPLPKSSLSQSIETPQDIEAISALIKEQLLKEAEINKEKEVHKMPSSTTDNDPTADIPVFSSVNDPLAKPEKEEKPKPIEDEANVVLGLKTREPLPSSDGKSYCYVNIMEEIIRNKMLETMHDQLDCTCSRCIADAMALTLSNLPPKYVVANKADVFPLLQYYSIKFQDQIVSQFTRSCMIVSESPHHDR